MYPDWALPEFYPPWLIKQAEDRGCKTVDEIHAYCTPRMKAMSKDDPFGGLTDRGPEWLAANYKD